MDTAKQDEIGEDHMPKRKFAQTRHLLLMADDRYARRKKSRDQNKDDGTDDGGGRDFIRRAVQGDLERGALNELQKPAGGP